MGERICPVLMDLQDVVPGENVARIDTLGEDQSSDFEYGQVRREFYLTSALAAANRCNACGITDSDIEEVLDDCPLIKSINRRAQLRLMVAHMMG